jgi:hypothetical protein
MFTPDFIGTAHRVDVRSVAAMRRALIPAEDEATRLHAATKAIRDVMKAARKDHKEDSPEFIARALFDQFNRERKEAAKSEAQSDD